jgi:hypothetical protein
MTGARFTLGGGLAATILVGVALLAFGPYRYLGVGAAVPAPTAKPRSARPPPLLGADGTPQPALPHAVPADPRARTQAALYATREQAQALDADLDGAVIWLDAAGELQPAIDRAEELRTRRHLGLDAPVFITGTAPARAAWVADRLTDDGYTQVFLVTR